MRYPNLSDQSESVFHLFLVSYWRKLLFSTVPSGAGAVLRVMRMQLAPCHIPAVVGEIRQFLQNKITVLPTTLCHLEHLLLLLEDAHSSGSARDNWGAARANISHYPVGLVGVRVGCLQRSIKIEGRV
jgi:hypothetical protein